MHCSEIFGAHNMSSSVSNIIDQFGGPEGRRRLVESLRQQRIVENSEELATKLAGVASIARHEPAVPFIVQENVPASRRKEWFPLDQFGIGFFSVFMLGDRVRVITRRPDRAETDALLLEFRDGISSRPFLSTPTPDA